MRRRLKYCAFIAVLFLCAPPKKMILPPVPDYFSQAEALFLKNPIAALEAYKSALGSGPDSLLRKKILERMFDIYFDQREYPMAFAVSESLPRESLSTLPVVLISLKKYDEILNNPTLPVLTRAFAAEQSGKGEEALGFYEQAQSAAPDYSRLKQAEILYKLGRDDSCKALLASFGTASKTLDLRIEIAFAESSWQDARESINRLPYSYKKLLLLARLSEKLGQDAETYYWEIIKNFPESPPALAAAKKLKSKTPSDCYYLGKILADADPATGELYLKKSLNGEFKEPAQRLLARLYLNRGNLKAAEEVLQDWRSAETGMLLAKVYLHEGFPDRGIRCFLDVARRFPKSDLATDAAYQAGLVLENQGNIDSACALYAQTGARELLIRSAVILTQIGKPDSAFKILARVDNAESFYFRAKLKEKSGSEPEADSLFRRLIKKFPFSYWTVTVLGRPEYQDSNPFPDSKPEAWFASWCDTTYTLTRSDSLHLRRAEVFLKSGLADEGIGELKLIENENPLFLYRLARLCADLGTDYYSIAYADRVRKKAGDNPPPLEMVKLLYPFRYGLTIQSSEGDRPFTLSVIRQESWFNPGAVSAASAFGLMQIIPATGRALAQKLNFEHFETDSLYNPGVSLKFGIRYLNDLVAQFGSKTLALAAYNAGPVSVQQWLEKRPGIAEDEFIQLIPYNETRGYVKACLLGDYIYRQIYDL